MQLHQLLMCFDNGKMQNINIHVEIKELLQFLNKIQYLHIKKIFCPNPKYYKFEEGDYIIVFERFLPFIYLVLFILDIIS